MKFYSSTLILVLPISRFQFPTGWNSTVYRPGNENRKHQRFNSQRDGILQIRFQRILNRSGFNSQRDGILPSYKPNASIAVGVSIPNGMEFYFRYFILEKRAYMFQFPTGWNSTKNMRFQTELIARFNSQRDGILLGVGLWGRRLYRCFNSQRDGILHERQDEHGQSSDGFNSQRDGILLQAPITPR